MNSLKLLDKAVEQFASLPGIGRKTALKFVLNLLKREDEEVKAFTESIIDLKKIFGNVPYAIISRMGRFAISAQIPSGTGPLSVLSKISRISFPLRLHPNTMACTTYWEESSPPWTASVRQICTSHH